MKAQIVVIAEQRQGSITPETLETVSFAVDLGTVTKMRVGIIIPGSPVKTMAETLAKASGMDVIGIDGKDLELYNGEAYKKAFSELLEEIAPSYVCLPHTAMGYDIAPALALRLGASCITAIEKISKKGDHATFCRSQWGGKVMAEMEPSTERSILTVLPGAWPAFGGKPDRQGTVKVIDTDSEIRNSKTIKLRASERTEFDLSKAETILSAGKGLGREENISLIYSLSKIFPKSAVGASRAACDAGWFDYGRQIGMTGKTVAPKLYIAFGISGSSQHIAGMKGSQTIVAVNTDPQASIFSVADYCIVEDLATFIPCILEEYSKLFDRHKEPE